MQAQRFTGCALAPSVERNGGFFVQRSIMGKLARILRYHNFMGCSGD